MAVHPLAALALAAALTGCMTVHPGTARPADLDDLRAEEGWILVDDVPWVAQESARDCGAACLSMVLAHWGEAAPPATIEAECAVAGREGLPASALRDAARRRGFQAFVVEGLLADLEHELARGRPVVVGLLKPHGETFTSHFAVVVGIHPARMRIAALDPALGLVSDSLEGFAREWGPTGRVALVVFASPTKPEPAGATARNEGGAP